MLNKYLKAFTLVEMLVALAVSSIIIGAAYSSYQMVATQYKKNMDVAEMHTSGRAIMRIIERDVRMAGFEYRDKDAKVTYGTIGNPLAIKDSGNKCCDEVTVVYDYYDEEAKKAQRIKIRYWAEIYTSNKGSRYRLYKQKDILGENKKILTKPKLGAKEVMADYIEDFQLGNSDGGNYIFAIDNNKLHIYDLTKPGPSNNIAKFVKTIYLPDNTHQGGSMVFGPDGNIYFAIYGNYQWDIAVLNPKAAFDSNLKLFERIKSPQARICNFNPWLGIIGNTLYVDSCKSQNPYAYAYDISTKKLIKTIDKENPQLVDLFSSIHDTSKDGVSCMMAGNRKYAGCNHPQGKSFSTSFYGTYPKVIKFLDNNLLAHHSYNGAIFFNQLTRVSGPALSGGILTVPQTQHGQHRKAKTFNLTQVNLTRASALVAINLTLRTKNQYGKDRQFKKKDYHGGNFKLDKTDKYKRDTFSSTVLVRNLAL